MRDIVERLRNRIHDNHMDTERLIDEAADEIERLRSENENLRMDFWALREEYRELKAAMREGQE